MMEEQYAEEQYEQGPYPLDGQILSIDGSQKLAKRCRQAVHTDGKRKHMEVDWTAVLAVCGTCGLPLMPPRVYPGESLEAWGVLRLVLSRLW